MPTNKKRVYVSFDDELFALLEQKAADGNRSVSNLISTIVESVLFPGGRIKKPVKSKRGGKRLGSGRPKKLRSTTDE